MDLARRKVLAGFGLIAVEATMSPLVKNATASSSESLAAGTATCPFRLAVINDEISQDFEKACQIVSGDFGLRWIELRSMWDKNVTALDARKNCGRAENSRRTQTARHGCCQPPVQDRLAWCTAIIAERNTRSVSR